MSAQMIFQRDIYATSLCWTSVVMHLMSALGHKRTNHPRPKSTFVRCCPKADKICGAANVRFVPLADITVSRYFFGNRKVTKNRAPKPLGPALSGLASQYRGPPPICTG